MRMTEEKLNEVYYINKEIERLESELYRLRHRYFIKIKGGTPGIRKGTNVPADYPDRLRALELKLMESYDRLAGKRKEAEEFIESIEDGEMRLIVRMRFLEHKRWEEIGRELGMERTTVSKKFRQFVF